jgi:hypothetical protein
MKNRNLIVFFSFIAVFAMFLTSCQSGSQEATSDSEADEITETEMGEPADDWIVLFDGTSTENFKGYCKDGFPETGWEIVDNTLHCIGSGMGEAGGKGGDIITKEKYGNFELSLEWKISEGGNSGIFYLAQEKCGEDGQPIWQSAPEMQILDNEKHPDAKLGEAGNRQAGSLYDLIPADPQNANPAGEWNSTRIMVYKGTVVHYQNGENVLEYHLWTDDWNNMVAESKFRDYEDFVKPAQEGHIGLQDHGDDVWFRNIRIKLLD